MQPESAILSPLQQGLLTSPTSKARSLPGRQDPILGPAAAIEARRHTFATRLVQSGIDLDRVQRGIGHKSPIMTQRYAHHYPEGLRDGVQILDRVKRCDTKSTTVRRTSASVVVEVLEKMVGDTGIEPVASSV